MGLGLSNSFSLPLNSEEDMAANVQAPQSPQLDFNVVANALSTLGNQSRAYAQNPAAVNPGLAAIHQQLSALQANMDQQFNALGQNIDQRFRQVDNRFDQIDRRLDQINIHILAEYGSLLRVETLANCVVALEHPTNGNLGQRRDRLRRASGFTQYPTHEDTSENTVGFTTTREKGSAETCSSSSAMIAAWRGH